VKVVAVAVGAPWALVTFRRNNKIKAAELLLKLEEECKKCIPTLLKLEYLEDYERIYQKALVESLKSPAHYEGGDGAHIDEVDTVLRHLHACYHVRRLRVDVGALDRTYAYYLSIFASQSRPDLRKYTERFWPHVLFWAETAGQPFPKRLYRSVMQTGRRLLKWWRPTVPDSVQTGAEESVKASAGTDATSSDR
jgi:hypothetical protein